MSNIRELFGFRKQKPPTTSDALVESATWQPSDEAKAMAYALAEAAKAAAREADQLSAKRARSRMLTRFGIVALVVAAMVALWPSTPGGDGTKYKFKKIPFAPAVAVAGAVPGAQTSGHVAVIRLESEVGGDYFGPAVAANTPRYLAGAFAAAAQDPDLTAVLLYINSPGGGAGAAAQSYRIVKHYRELLAKKQIPVVAYVSQGAYSGGYYIALGAGAIYADPDADVANIGVIMSIFNTSKFGEMLGITENNVKSGLQKDVAHQWKPINDADNKMMLASLEHMFHHFLEAVSESRGIPMADLESEAQQVMGRSSGAYFNSEDALPRKLIDGIVPVEDLPQALASSLPQRRKYQKIEFIDYQAQQSLAEIIGKRTERAADGIAQRLLRSFFAPRAEVRAE